MEKNRLEAFTDGVLAIIITIMILELKQPPGDSVKDLLGLGPILCAYLISYLFIAIYWVNHHLIFQEADRINVRILWCNIAWLFIMSFIPFTTAWVGTYPLSWIPLSLYFADMLLACIAFHWMYGLIAGESGREYRLNTRSIASVITYSLATAAGGFYPILAYIAVAVVTCWWMIPEKEERDV